MKPRRALIQDADKISVLMSQLGYIVTPKLIEEKLSYSDASSTDEVFVVDDKNMLVGVVSCHVMSLFHQRGGCGRITSLVVDENTRGLGVGKLLVREADLFFRNAGCVKSEVTSGDHRLDAHAFYISCGYKEDVRRFLKMYS